MPKRRIFIAVQVPEEVKNTAEFYLKPFLNDRNIRIPKKEGWHITLIFCGYLDDKEETALEEIVKRAVLGLKSFEFAPRKILFAPLSRPRMIWLTFVAPAGFANLKNKIENDILALQSCGLFRDFRRENREPNSHLTLARFEENYFWQIKKFLPEKGVDLTEETEPFSAKSVDIMESHLSRQGADYELVLSITLK